MHDNTGADELMLTAHTYDHAARLRSFDLAAVALRGLDGTRRGDGCLPRVRREAVSP